MSGGTFEKVTRAAIEELITRNTSESKFGYILTSESYKNLVNEIYDLLLTSRSLKGAGDRFLARSGASVRTTAIDRD